MNIFKLYNTYLIKNFDEGGVIEPPEPGIYPLSAITENISPFYEQGYELYNSKIKTYLRKNPCAYVGTYGDSYQVLDGDYENYINNTSMLFIFNQPVTATYFDIKIGSDGWNLWATNDEEQIELLCSSINSVDYTKGDYLIESGENTASESQGKSFAINENRNKYKLYKFSYLYSYSNIYQMNLTISQKKK